MSGVQLYCRLPAHWWIDPSQCWFEWQGLVSGILAVVAAIVSIWFLQRQIAQTDQLHQNELKRRHNAIRSVVPVALAAISEYCAAVCNEIASAIEDRQDNFNVAFDAHAKGKLEKATFDGVNFPSDVIPTLQAFVETLTRPDDVKHMAELLGSLQILQSRFKTFNLKQIAVEHSLHSLLLDVAKVKFLTDSIFNYGRFVDEDSFSRIEGTKNESLWDEILGKAQGLVFGRPAPDLFFPKLDELVTARKNSLTSPWNEKFK